MADVKIKVSYTVQPAGKPWTGTMKLGEWEQLATSGYVQTVYMYQPTEEWASSGKSFSETLKRSLSEALFHFYPFAGRLHKGPGGKAELRCESQGVEVLEAESSSVLADFGDFSCVQKFQHLVPVVDVMRKPLHELPLLSAMITVFQCGGLCLGMATNHSIADGVSAYHFFNEWARLARGEPLQTPPVLDRTLIRAGEPPRGPGFGPADGQAPDVPPHMPTMKETSMIVLPLSNAQIDKLKTAANGTTVDEPTKDRNTSYRPFSRYEVLTGHIWRCVCKAMESKGEEPKAISITLDARRRMQPPLPTHYFGNAVMMVAAKSQARDLVERPLGYACAKIRETISKVTNEYIQADIDHIKRSENLMMFQGVRCPVDLSFAKLELGVISWLTLPVQGLNFGWGDHIHMGPGPTNMEGITALLPRKDGDGSVVVHICLQLEHVEKFKSYFYQDLA